MAKRYISEIFVLRPGDLARMTIAAFHGNSEATTLSRIVFDWIEQVIRKKPGEKPLCLNCDAECLNDPAWSIVVTVPYAKAKGKAVVSGICPDCAGRDDITTIITDKITELHGGGYVIAEGRA